MRRMLAVLALTLAALPALAKTVPIPLPGWMAGAWEKHDGDSWSDEFWTPPRAGLMIGAAREGKGQTLAIFEHTRIVRKPDGSLSYFAQPRGVPPSEFPMVGSGADWMEFANSAQDYPQRIRYWREGPLLKARISLMDGSNAFEWTYQPMGAPE
jgi:hypothetical protein